MKIRITYKFMVHLGFGIKFEKIVNKNAYYYLNNKTKLTINNRMVTPVKPRRI
jgi:hypothetical protein